MIALNKPPQSVSSPMSEEPQPSRRGDLSSRVVVLLEHEDGYRTPLLVQLDGAPLPLMWGNSDVVLRYHQQHYESRIIAVSIATLASPVPAQSPTRRRNDAAHQNHKPPS